MPPALSDDASSDNEVGRFLSPAQKSPNTKKSEPVEEEVEEEAEDGDEEGAPDEFVVEKIMGHKFKDGNLIFEVKWQGYEAKKDRTWEPEENMDGAADVVTEYFEEIGGRPEQPKGAGKRKGRQSGVKSKSGTPASSAKRVKQEKTWSPPPGSWELDVSHIDTVEESQDPKTGSQGRFAYLVWNNNKKTQHPLKHVYQKCPQKMLQYYESHLVFTQNDIMNGDSDNMMMKDAY